MIHVTEFATEPQKHPLNQRIDSVALQPTYNLVALWRGKLQQDF